MKSKPTRKVFLVEGAAEYLVWESSNILQVQTHRGPTRYLATLFRFNSRSWQKVEGPFPVMGIFPSKRKAIQKRREYALFKSVHAS